MASLSQGVMMSSPTSDLWWSAFLDMHGRDSEEEKAFTGYLSQHGIPAGSPADVLAAAYAEFLAFVQASYEAVGEPEPEPKAMEARAEEVKQDRVPRSSMSVAEREKPMDAATRPPALREKDGPGAAATLTDPQAATAAGAAGAPQAPGPETPATTQAEEEARHRQATEAEAQRHAQEEETRQRGRRG